MSWPAWCCWRLCHHRPQEVIVAIQVHGNTLTSDAEIVRASGLSEGNLFSESVLSDAEARLRAFKRFYQVDVLKRYASITDPSQVLVVIQVDEGPVRIDSGGIPGVPGQSPTAVRRRRFNMMAVPLLDAEDGYGLTYGGSFAFTGHRNTTRRVIVPLTWGGDNAHLRNFRRNGHRGSPRRFGPALSCSAARIRSSTATRIESECGGERSGSLRGPFAQAVKLPGRIDVGRRAYENQVDWRRPHHRHEGRSAHAAQRDPREGGGRAVEVLAGLNPEEPSSRRTATSDSIGAWSWRCERSAKM